MNIYKRFIAHIFKKPHIPEDMTEYCANETHKINQTRFSYLAPLIICAVAIIVVTYFIDAILHGINSLLAAYIITDSAYLVFLACCYALWRTRRIFHEKYFNILLYLTFSASLIWTAMLSIFQNDVTCLIMALLLFSIAFTTKPRVFFLTQISVLLPLLAALPFLWITDGFSLMLNYINILFCSLLSIYMSRIVYNSALENIANKRIIELKNEDLGEFILKLKDLSEVDALTTLLNRRKFDEVMRREWKRAVWNASGLALILIDIDFFKNYNDTYGHMKGDVCLSLIGETLKSKFVRANEYAARYGGEEFAIIIANSGEDDGISACKRLLESVSTLRIPHGRSNASDVVTVSAGMIWAVPKEDDSLDDFINKADSALYEAKAAGRNRYVVAKYTQSGAV